MKLLLSKAAPIIAISTSLFSCDSSKSDPLKISNNTPNKIEALKAPKKNKTDKVKEITSDLIDLGIDFINPDEEQNTPPERSDINKI
ncbi:hypothetical protein [Candidatus Liberibacter brunswickensis]|uniref:hypothetical protein n=1 Tax=Candidatus Liberibacter brunswickensis TaxID=1968796 RepID=UPI002FDFE1F5